MTARTAKLADRASKASIALILVFNLLFVLAFFATLLGATIGARATEPTACTGTDLMAGLPADALSRMRAAADATPNGQGLLWKIEREGVAPSYLFGTMHMTDERVVRLPDNAQDAYDRASTVVIETTDVLDQSKMMGAMLERPELMMFTGDGSLEKLLDDGEEATVREGLAARDISFASVARMKPWILSAMVALPACEMARKAAGAPVLDLKLAHDAMAAGKPVEGLETMVDQLQAMASLPLEFHVRGLVDTLKLGDRIDDVIETMILLYGRGDTGMFWPLMREVLPEAKADAAGYAAFEKAMVTARNHTMAEHAAPLIDRGGAFIAVGALHLPGTQGVVELLRGRGYAISPAS